MAWIDQHCHIDPGPDGVAQVAEAKAAGVMRMVSVGCDLEQSTQMAAIATEISLSKMLLLLPIMAETMMKPMAPILLT